jgi:hypothetical protein
MSFASISPELGHGFLCNGLIRLRWVERDNALKLDRREVSVGLSLLERILIDDRSIKKLSVFPKWSRRELQNPLPCKALLKVAPGRRFNVMRLIDEQVRAVVSHALLHGRRTLARNAASRHNHLGASKDRVDLLRCPRDVLKGAHNWMLGVGTEHSGPSSHKDAERKKLIGKLRTQSIRGDYD